MAVTFPSLEFFQALQREMRSEKERFSRLGFFDTTFGIRVVAENEGRPAEFVLAFDVFDCVDVRAGRAEEAGRAAAEGPTHRPPRDCPVCSHRLATTRLGCPHCGTEISGGFVACAYCGLSDDDLELLRVFLVSRGNMKELERHLGVSYPTARQRFERSLAATSCRSRMAMHAIIFCRRTWPAKRRPETSSPSSRSGRSGPC
jgi:hypothetical protein